MGQGLHALAAGLASAVLALASPPVFALQPAPLVTPAGQVELARLVDLASQRLSLNIEYDAAVLRGSATLRLDAGLSDDELWTLTNRVLASRGFTTVRAPGEAAYSVVRLADAAAAAQDRQTLSETRASGTDAAEY